MLIEAYKPSGAIKLAQIFDYDLLQCLLEQTARLRRDPELVKKEIDKIEHEEWVERNQETVFVFEGETDGESFSISEFL